MPSDHKHEWCVFIRGSKEVTAFRLCLGCDAREDCPLPADYPMGVAAADAPAYILPAGNAQLSLWETL